MSLRTSDPEGDQVNLMRQLRVPLIDESDGRQDVAGPWRLAEPAGAPHLVAASRIQILRITGTHRKRVSLVGICCYTRNTPRLLYATRRDGSPTLSSPPCSPTCTAG
jgi:hypothetical protein